VPWSYRRRSLFSSTYNGWREDIRGLRTPRESILKSGRGRKGQRYSEHSDSGKERMEGHVLVRQVQGGHEIRVPGVWRRHYVVTLLYQRCRCRMTCGMRRCVRRWGRGTGWRGCRGEDRRRVRSWTSVTGRGLGKLGGQRSRWRIGVNRDFQGYLWWRREIEGFSWGKGCVKWDVPGVIYRSTKRRRKERLRRNGCSEGGTTDDHVFEFRNSNPFRGITFKNASQYAIKLLRKRQDRFEKFWVPQKGSESGVFDGSLFPWIAATGKIDQDNSKRPHIIGSRCIAWECFWWRLVTFYMTD